ncbi:MAG: lamin tail domain-containing protein, partial [Bacteroidales bacterium]
MKRTILFIIAIFFVWVASAQFTDDFSDGDFTSNPEWTGETSKFQVSAANELQLYDASESGTAYLVTQSLAINNASWEFLVRFDFNPSSTSYVNVYLVSDQTVLDNNLNGYFVRVGNTEDEISLYRQDGDNKTEIIDGTNDRIDMTSVNVRVKVTRDDSGNWTLQSDTLGGTNYFTEGSTFDDTHIMSYYFGVECIYYYTRWDKIFFDDFVVTGDPYNDTVKPELNSLDVVDNTHLRLNFSEPMESTSTLNTSNYTVNNGIENPSNASFDGGDATKVLLEFATAFDNYTAYNLSYQNCEDLFGNVIEAGSMEFSYVVIQQYDIVINEIMADPSPVVGLPEAEYLEIYNTLDVAVNLSGFQLMIGSSTYEFAAVNLPADAEMIVCKSSDSTLLAPFGLVTAPESLSGYILPNSGATVKILDDSSNVVDEIHYTNEWYQDPD